MRFAFDARLQQKGKILNHLSGIGAIALSSSCGEGRISSSFEDTSISIEASARF